MGSGGRWKQDTGGIMTLVIKGDWLDQETGGIMRHRWDQETGGIRRQAGSRGRWDQETEETRSYRDQ